MTREEQMMDSAKSAELNSRTIDLSKKDVFMSAYIQGWKDADSHPQWIPVEEELPPKRKDPLVISDKVFIHTTGGHYLSAVYDYQDKEWIDEYNIETLESNEVTHWMEIVPPKKEE